MPNPIFSAAPSAPRVFAILRDPATRHTGQNKSTDGMKLKLRTKTEMIIQMDIKVGAEMKVGWNRSRDGD